VAAVNLGDVRKGVERALGKDALCAADGDHLIVFVRPADVPRAAEALSKLGFDHLSCVIGVDYPGGEVFARTFPSSALKELDAAFTRPCLEVVYEVTSYAHCLFARLKTRVPRDAPVVPTVTEVWWNADWYERETYDLLGIRFEGHPNLRRLLLFDEFHGHPLRKDFREARR